MLPKLLQTWATTKQEYQDSGYKEEQLTTKGWQRSLEGRCQSGRKASAKPRSSRKADPERLKPSSNSKGRSKGKKGKRGRGPNIPKGLIGKSLQTQSGERLCWAYNLEQGCKEAQPGERCQRGYHWCAKPNCNKAHNFAASQITSAHGQPNFAWAIQSKHSEPLLSWPPFAWFFLYRSSLEQVAWPLHSDV